MLQAWLDYYLGLGVSSFHFIVHGEATENAKLVELTRRYPIFVEDRYGDEFASEEKLRRIEAILAQWRGQWVLLVDSDEFVEFPYRRLSATVRFLEFFKATALCAPMVQRLTLNGSLRTPATIPNPFRYFRLCSLDLYRQMGVEAATVKYPLFYCHDATVISDAGNHSPPNGPSTALSPLQGITHHFKFRSTALKKIIRRAQSRHTWRHESARYLAYLRSHSLKLPTANSFPYSRTELFRRGLLRRAPISDFLICAARRLIGRLPGPFQSTGRICYGTLRRALPKRTPVDHAVTLPDRRNVRWTRQDERFPSRS